MEIRIETNNTNRIKFEKVALRVPKVGDMIAAERMAGEHASDINSTAALFAVIGTFDGKRVMMEDILNMEVSDFLELQEAAKGLISQQLQTQLSSSSKKETLPTKL